MFVLRAATLWLCSRCPCSTLASPAAHCPQIQMPMCLLLSDRDLTTRPELDLLPVFALSLHYNIRAMLREFQWRQGLSWLKLSVHQLPLNPKSLKPPNPIAIRPWLQYMSDWCTTSQLSPMPKKVADVGDLILAQGIGYFRPITQTCQSLITLSYVSK